MENAKNTKKRKSSKAEIATRQMLLKRQEDFYNSRLSSLYEKYKGVIEENNILKEENDCVKRELANIIFEQALAEQREEEEKAELLKGYQNKVISCTKSRNSILNIGFSKDKDKQNITGRELKITFIDGISCKSLRHYADDKEARIVIETMREKDKLCLSFCYECLCVFIAALKSVDESNPSYINNYYDIEVVYTSNSKGQPCFSCYRADKPSYYIRLGNTAFKLCPDCRACWLMQLESAARRLIK